MSSDAWAFVIVAAIVLWSALWWRIGASCFRWDAYNMGVRKGREEEVDEAYTQGFENGVKSACKDRVLPTQLSPEGRGGTPRSRVRKPRP